MSSKKASNRATAVMAVLVSLGAGALVWSNRSIPENIRTERRSRAISGLRRDLIDHVEIDRGTEQIQLFKVNGRWTVTVQGARVEADDTEVERLLSELEYAQPIRVLGAMDARNRAEFGLTAPRARVALYEQNHGAIVRFEVGRDVTGDQGVYVENEQQGYVLSPTVAHAFLVHGRDLRARNLVEIDASRVTSIRVSKGTTQLNIEKRNGFWAIVNGERIGRAPIEALLAELHELRATRYLEDSASDERLAALGLSPARSQLVIERSGQSSVSVSFGNPCPGHADEVLVRRNTDRVVACVQNSAAGYADRELDRWRDNRLFFARGDEVEKVVLHSNNRDFMLQRTADGWRVEGSTEAVDSEAVQQWLDSSLATMVEQRGADAGVASAASTNSSWIEIARTGIEARERVTVLQSDSEHTVVRRESDGVVLAINQRAVSELFIDDVRFRATSVIRDVPEELRAIVTESSEFRDEVNKRDGRWQLLRPITLDADPLVLRSTAERLASLDAVRWVSRSIVSSFGLTAPRGRLIARFEGDGPQLEDGGSARIREYTLLIGASSPDGVFCKIAEREGVFLLTQSIVDELLQPHIQRSIFSMQRDSIERVVLTSRGRPRVELTRTPTGWQTQSGTRADRTQVERLLGLLENVRAPRVFGYGPSPATHNMGRASIELFVSATERDAGVQAFSLTLGGEFAGQPGGVYARLAGIDATMSVSLEVANAVTIFTP